MIGDGFGGGGLSLGTEIVGGGGGGNVLSGNGGSATLEETLNDAGIVIASGNNGNSLILGGNGVGGENVGGNSGAIVLGGGVSESGLLFETHEDSLPFMDDLQSLLNDANARNLFAGEFRTVSQILCSMGKRTEGQILSLMELSMSFRN